MGDARFKRSSLTNKLTAKQKVELVRVIEECAELQYAATKMLRFGPASYNPFAPQLGSNMEQFDKEYADLEQTVKDFRKVSQ